MPDSGEVLTTQMGLMLTRLTSVRRVLEDIERNTRKFAGLGQALVSATAAGKALGAPPLHNGALMVHIVNINDLKGRTGFFQDLLGGIGRFVGGLVGGVVGGTIGGAVLIPNLVFLSRIASSVENIIERLGIGKGGGDSGGGNTLTELITRVESFVDKLTIMFRAADSSAPVTAQGRQLAEQARAFLQPLQVTSRIVDGLIILVPILIGALATVLFRLSQIKLAVIDMLSFVMRNVFLLRGIVLTTFLETAAAAATLGADVLGHFGTAVGNILTGVFSILGAILKVAEVGFRFVASGLKKMIDGLQDWLRDGLGNVLIFLGNLRVFRVAVHIIQVLPGILPAILRLLDTPLTPTELATLNKYSAVTIPGATAIGKAAGGKIAPFPDLAAALPSTTSLTTELTKAKKSIAEDVTSIFTASQKALTDTAASLKKALTDGEAAFSKALDTRISALETRSKDLSGALEAARKAAEKTVDSGLGKIVEAYEKWLQGGGMEAILQRINQHFATPAGQATLKQIDAAAGIQPRATISAPEVVIELEPPETDQTGALLDDDVDKEPKYAEWRRRGGSPMAYAELALEDGLA